MFPLSSAFLRHKHLLNSVLPLPQAGLDWTTRRLVRYGCHTDHAPCSPCSAVLVCSSDQVIQSEGEEGKKQINKHILQVGLWGMNFP